MHVEKFRMSSVRTAISGRPRQTPIRTSTRQPSSSPDCTVNLEEPSIVVDANMPLRRTGSFAAGAGRLAVCSASLPAPCARYANGRVSTSAVRRVFAFGCSANASHARLAIAARNII